MPSLEHEMPCNAFTILIDALASSLGTSGIAPEDIDITSVETLMRNYTSDPSDWSPYVQTWAEDNKPYVRNMVDAGNGKYNLVSPAPCRRYDVH
jgi:cysteine dioxygenase